MEQELISKKELLEKYGISYGALYRWKRKGLIPEDWFIKKSTVTGQETFFPKVLICQRVELIMDQKDEHSLDDLAGQINQNSQKQAVLIVRTVYGDRSFTLSDIRELTLEKGDGTQVDLTHLIK
ncbi:MAG: DUF4004 family protein [Ruminococcaceae bacterium]|nr:DUF4004 family protein [Oscillospiraceae bacterium]